MKRHRRIDPICQRRSDGTFWRPSVPDGYDMGMAVADTLRGTRSWFFRGVRRVQRRLLFDYWVETGETWRPAKGREFAVLKHADAVGQLGEAPVLTARRIEVLFGIVVAAACAGVAIHWWT